MLKDDYLVVKIGVDTANNEPFKSGDVLSERKTDLQRYNGLAQKLTRAHCSVFAPDMQGFGQSDGMRGSPCTARRRLAKPSVHLQPDLFSELRSKRVVDHVD